MAGFSFTANQLIARLRTSMFPDLTLAPSASAVATGAAAELARAWPDSLSGEAARRDLGFKPTRLLDETIREICTAHAHRLGKPLPSRL